MGVYIRLDILPERISKEEWEKVYEESLELVNSYPLATIIKERVGDSERLVLDEAREQGTGENRFWSASGDMESKETGESFRLYRNMDKYSISKGVGDKDILKVIIEDEKGVSIVFDSKTQGEKYHFYILSIASLVEDRLKGRAIAYGDITKEQAERAIELANEVLENYIKLPIRVDKEELVKRLQKLGNKSLSNFFDLYITENRDNLGGFIRENFSEEEIMSYFKNEFRGYKSATQLGAEKIMIEFLNMGYSLEKLCDICCIDEDGAKYKEEGFIKAVCSALVFVEIEHRNSMDTFVKEAVRPQFVEYQFGTAFLDMCGLLGRYCHRYIPMEEGIKILRHKLGDKTAIEDIVKKEYDEALEILNTYGKELQDIEKEYSETVEKEIITEYEALIGWDDSFTIAESIDSSIKNILKQIKEAINNGNYKVVSILNSLSTKEEFIEIIADFTNNLNLLLSRNAWNWIDEMEDFELLKYIALMIGLCSENRLRGMVRGMLENKKLFNKYMAVKD